MCIYTHISLYMIYTCHASDRNYVNTNHVYNYRYVYPLLVHPMLAIIVMHVMVTGTDIFIALKLGEFLSLLIL